jgi:hypothetical protein
MKRIITNSKFDIKNTISSHNLLTTSEMLCIRGGDCPPTNPILK